MEYAGTRGAGTISAEKILTPTLFSGRTVLLAILTKYSRPIDSACSAQILIGSTLWRRVLAVKVSTPSEVATLVGVAFHHTCSRTTAADLSQLASRSRWIQG